MTKPILLAILSVVLISGMILNANAQPSQKYVMFVFDDNPIGQYNYAKPVLDTYAYKASFMIVCNWVNQGNNPARMSWDQIGQLGKDGMDIESHSMTHPDFNHLSASQLNFELNGSKNCLNEHGYNAIAFSYPRGHGAENSTVISAVAQYYSIGKTLAPKDIMQFLPCQGYLGNESQTNCAIFKNNGQPQWDSALVLRSHSIDNLELADGFNDTTVYNDFVTWMQNEAQYNSQSITLAIPIVALHEIVDPATQSFWLHTNQVLFAKMLSYLHNNGYTTITLKDLGYNTATKMLYIKQVQSQSQTTGSILTLNPIDWPKAGGTMTISGKLVCTSGSPIANAKITFTGNGAQNILSVITKSDGTFSSIGQAPTVQPQEKKWNEYQLNAIYNGNNENSPSLSILYFAVN